MIGDDRAMMKSKVGDRAVGLDAAVAAGRGSAADGGGVLYVAPFEPWCRENGSSVVMADLLEALEDERVPEVLPVFIRHAPPGAGQARPGRRPGITLGVEPQPKWLSVPLALATGRAPWWELRFRDAQLARSIDEVASRAELKPTLVHVEHLVLVELGRRLARKYGCPLVYRAHNIESALYGRLIGDDRRWKRAFNRRLEQREAAAIARCDLTLCISEVDLAWVRERVPDARADVLPVGLQLDRFAAPDGAAAESAATDAPSLGFVGGLEWQPNEIGLRWFVERVFPIIRAHVPDARLDVLARGADVRPWLTSNPDVRLLSPAHVPADLFRRSRVSIAPLLEGGGVRVKVLESLAAGCPVVATSIGGEGLELPGLVHADAPEDFARACIRYLTHPPDYAARQELRDGLAARHGAAAVAGRLIAHWASVAEMRQTTARALATRI